MRPHPSSITVAVLCFLAFHAAATEPSERELIDAVQRETKAVVDRCAPSAAAVVVSRSDLYPDRPNAADAALGKLGGFDRDRFLKDSTRTDKDELSRRLDLSDRGSIPDNSYTGGAVVDDAGSVLVAYHAIEGATKLYVRLPGGRGSYADVHAADARSDLAVLRMIAPPAGLRSLPVAGGRSGGLPGGPKPAVERGKWVVLLSNSYDSIFSDRPTGVLAVISAVRERAAVRADSQSRAWTVYQFGHLLQFAGQFPAAGRRANTGGGSGGLLLNLEGELVGLTTSAAAPDGADDAGGFALPMDGHARRVLGVLLRGEEVEYGFLGVQYSNPDPALPGMRRTAGIPIDVTANGPAERAGLRKGDIIKRVDGEPIEDSRDLVLHVGSALAGRKARIAVERTVLRVEGARRFEETKEVEIDALLGKYQHSLAFVASVRPEPVFGLRVDHGSLLHQQLGFDQPTAIPEGVLVREVVPGSPAAERFKGLNDGVGQWLVVAVDGAAVSTPAEFLAAARGKKSLALSVLDPTAVPVRPRQITLP